MITPIRRKALGASSDKVYQQTRGDQRQWYAEACPELQMLCVAEGGGDTWMNLVTACRGCNQRKGGRTPERAGMHLLYAPYIPNRAEYLILSNRHILADQMDFLARHVPAQGRVRLAS